VNEDLGNKCKQAGDLKTAMAYYRQAIAMKPDLAEARSNLELALQSNS
jgi:Flp pilus assembly protein TadD